MVRTLQLPSRIDRIPWATKQLLDVLKKAKWDDNILFDIRLAVEEALTNAVKHGNGEDSSQKIRFQFALDSQKNQVTVTIEDQGKGFDPSTTPRSKGYGLVLMRQFMDDIQYNRRGNQVKMIKKRR